jgi:ankyrin repeat protein
MASTKIFDLLSKPSSSTISSLTKYLETSKDAIQIKNDKGESLLIVALKNGLEDCALLLVSEVADLQGNPNPLHMAARQGFAKVIAKLIEKGVDPLVKDEDNNVALHLAAKNGQAELIQLLGTKTPINGTHEYL